MSFETYALDLSQLGAPNAAAALPGEGALDALPARSAAGRRLRRKQYPSASRSRSTSRTTRAALHAGLRASSRWPSSGGRAPTGRTAASRSPPSCSLPRAARRRLRGRGGGARIRARRSRSSTRSRSPASRFGLYAIARGARLRMPRLRRGGVGRRSRMSGSERCGGASPPVARRGRLPMTPACSTSTSPGASPRRWR